MQRNEIRVRDPYIVLDNGTYYLYATTGEKTLSFYTGTDLDHWELGGVAFEIPDDSWACKDVWAAEVHRYKGKFYLFVSLLGKDGLRGTQIAVADTPAGPFVPLVNRPATPKGQSCIDGTLYVCEDVPYILYSHDWPDCYVAEKNAFVGQICAVRLSEDLTSIAGEPWVLFDSDEAPISAATPDIMEQAYYGKTNIRYGTDAPFVQTLSNGSLLLTWSPYLNDNYVVLGAISRNGDIKGPWEHLDAPIFDNNGGHAMFFYDREGRHCMCLHAPEKQMLERACLFEVEEKDGKLVILRSI